jgi:hypothetical protein
MFQSLLIYMTNMFFISLNLPVDFQGALLKRLLGECLRTHDQISEALDAFQKAKDLIMRTTHLDEVADALSHISDGYYCSSQFEKSLASILEAPKAQGVKPDHERIYHPQTWLLPLYASSGCLGNDLPDDVWRIVVSFLPTEVVLQMISVNRTFFNMALDMKYRQVVWIKLDSGFLKILHRLQ